MRLFLRRVWYTIRQRRVDADLREELALHRDLKQEELERGGVTASEAAFEARRALGSVAMARDQARDVWRFRWLQGLGLDVRLAGRTLRNTPVLTTVAVLSLALGIGANTAIFSIVNGLLLRGLPVSAPERLVTISTDQAISSGSTAAWSYPVFDRIRQLELFDGMAASATSRFNLAAGSEAEFVDGVWANGTFFDVLGVRPWIGRAFTQADDERGGGPDGPVAVLSYGFWQRRFGGGRDALGQSLTIEGVPFTVVGVTPPEFFGVTVGRTFDVIVPFGDEPVVRGKETKLDTRAFYWLTLMGRLKAAEGTAGANAALRGVQPQVREATLPVLPPQFAAQYLAGRAGFTLVPASTNSSGLRHRFERPILAIMVAVVLVLLIACANVANLLTARATARRHELSVRRALGAPRWRLARQFFAESATLAVAGAVPGVLFASWFAQLLVQQLSTRTNTVFLDVSIDARVLLFTVGVTLATTLLFGVAPALRMSDVVPAEALRDSGRSTTGDGRTRVTSAFLVAQVSLSIVLVVGAGLFVRTFWTLATRDLGFAPEHVLLVSVNSQRAGIDAAARLPLYEHVRTAAAALPGVTDAALSTVTPVQGGGQVPHIEVSGGVDVPDRTSLPPGNGWTNQISPGWLRTLRTPLVAGRDFSDRDRQGAPRVALVNEALVRTFLLGANPLGHTVTLGGPSSARLEIVGVVADAVYASPRELPQPTVYVPLDQITPPPTISLSVRASGPPAQLSRAIAAAVGSLNPDVVLTFQPLVEQVNGALAQERVVALLSGFFGALALLLAGLGLYGVTAYAVSRRRREIGLRMALGATPGGVVRMILVQVSLLVSAGVAIGTIASIWASASVATLLYGVEPRDPATLLGATAVLAAIAFAAAGLPAWRAARMDPAVELRDA